MIKRGKIRESGRRSKLEDDFATLLKQLKIPEHYEETKLKYIIPQSEHTYTVDFTLPNHILLECKGYLRDVEERQKYELIKEQHPDKDLRFVFANPNKPISRTKMTHGSWAEKVGFKYCSVNDSDIIKEWSKE